MKRIVAATLIAGAALVLSAVQPARADIVYDYTVSGTYTDGTSSGGTLSGTLAFDATTGLVTSADIDASSVGTFSDVTPTSQGLAFVTGPDYLVTISNGAALGLGLGLDNYASLLAGQTTSIAS